MTDNHPITPPPELVREWTQNRGYSYAYELWNYLAAQAAQWGADKELEACCEWVGKVAIVQMANNLRIDRRPKPPSLKEQAIAALNVIEDKMLGPTTEEKLIRKALEALPND